MADPGKGHPTPTHPPMGPNSFLFGYVFAEKCLHRRLPPPSPLRGRCLHPHPTGNLDPPLARLLDANAVYEFYIFSFIVQIYKAPCLRSIHTERDATSCKRELICHKFGLQYRLWYYSHQVTLHPVRLGSISNFMACDKQYYLKCEQAIIAPSDTCWVVFSLVWLNSIWQANSQTDKPMYVEV